jgi:hypothetical protein
MGSCEIVAGGGDRASSRRRRYALIRVHPSVITDAGDVAMNVAINIWHAQP